MAKRSGSLGRSVLDLDVDDSKFVSGMDRNKKRAQSWIGSLNGDVKKGLAQGLGLGAGLGVASAISSGVGMVKDAVAASIGAAIEWESAMAGVSKTVDASEQELAELGEGLIALSEEMPITSTELAGLAEAAGALGVAKKDILEFTRVTAMIGTTTDVSADQAATSLGQLSNVLGLTAEDYERFGSTLVDLGNKGASTESQILEIAARAGAGSKLIGMATDETLAWASAVANLGIEVEAGGSALQKFFLDSTKSIVNGGEELEVYARTAGMTGTAFKKAFEEDASGALQVFLAGLGQLSQGEQLKVLEDLDFNDVRITRTLLGLANNATNLGSALDVASEAWEENLALGAEAEKRYSTTESKLQILGNRVNNLAAEFGEHLLPALIGVSTWFVDTFSGLIENTAKEIDAIGDVFRGAQMYFGDLGKTVEDRANEIGEDVGEMKDLVLFAMNEMGMGIDDAMEYAERRLAGLPPVMSEAAQESLQSFKEQEWRVGMEQTAEEGVAGFAAGIDPLSEMTEEEMEAARKAAVAGMKAILDGLNNSLRDGKAGYEQSWEDFLDGQKDPFTTAQRNAFIAGMFSGDEFDRGLHSKDPEHVANTVEFVNTQLAEFNLLNPGAFLTGQGVPANLQAGMDEIMPELQQYVMDKTGETLENLSLEEAAELGLDGIYLWWTGMLSQEQAVKDAAADLLSYVETSLNMSGFAWGEHLVETFAAGMEAQGLTVEQAALAIAGYASGPIAFSEPPEKGPLSDIDLWGVHMDQRLAKSMLKGVGVVADAALGVAEAALPPSLSTSLAGMSAMPSASVAGMSDLASADARLFGATGSVAGASITNIWQLNVEGEPIVVGNRNDILDGWDRLDRMSRHVGGRV